LAIPLAPNRYVSDYARRVLIRGESRICFVSAKIWIPFGV
jgi:hypothetical protein